MDLIYIDPPFDTGADFSYLATLAALESEEDGERVFLKEPSILEQKAYRDTWGHGLDSYLEWFCTTAAVAEKLNRRWIACDLGRFAIHTTRKRLLGISGVKPFVVQNLGKYERQQWQVAEFAPTPVILSGVNAPPCGAFTESKDPVPAGSQQRPDREFSRDRGGNASPRLSSQPAGAGSFDAAVGSPSRTNRSAQDDRLTQQQQREAAYRKFILELYHATPVSGHVCLHGVKAGRMVHVGAVDAPVTRADVNSIAAAFKKIPREVLEKKAVEQGDVHFFELGALKVDSKIKKRELTLTLSNFIIPLDDVPAEVRSAIKHWSQMVDYWAVDWDYKDDTFHTSGSPTAPARTQSWSCR